MYGGVGGEESRDSSLSRLPKNGEAGDAPASRLHYFTDTEDARPVLSVTTYVPATASFTVNDVAL